jgi:hypothetical protein
VIDRGIRECDDFALVVSQYSMSSAVVREEIDLAKRYQKTLCAIILDANVDLSMLPSSIHYVRLSGANSNDLHAAITSLFSVARPNIDDQNINPHIMKTLAARYVWPAYAHDAHAGPMMTNARRVLKSASEVSADHSAIVLNHALLECSAGQYESGLRDLDRYACAADNFAGWYFLSLLLPRTVGIRNVTVAVARAGFDAAQRAAERGCNPLSTLLLGLYEVCAENLSVRRLDRAIQDFHAVRAQVDEYPSEYLRFYMAMRSNLSEFGSHAIILKNMFREVVVNDKRSE